MGVASGTTGAATLYFSPLKCHRYSVTVARHYTRVIVKTCIAWWSHANLKKLSWHNALIIIAMAMMWYLYEGVLRERTACFSDRIRIRKILRSALVKTARASPCRGGGPYPDPSPSSSPRPSSRPYHRDSNSNAVKTARDALTHYREIEYSCALRRRNSALSDIEP